MQFSDFIAPFEATRFRAEYFGKLPVHIRSNGESRPNLLNWSRFNQVLAITPYWNEDALKVVCRSRAALRDKHCDTTDLRERLRKPADRIRIVLTSPALAIDVLNDQRDLELLERAGILVETEMQQ